MSFYLRCIQSHQRRRALGHQRPFGRRHRYFGIGQRLAQMHDLRFAVNILAFDALQKIDPLFDGRRNLIGQDQRHQGVRGGGIGQAVDHAAVHREGLQEFGTERDLHLHPALAGVEQFHAHEFQKGVVSGDWLEQFEYVHC